MADNLKPCPFCGGEAQYGKETDEFGVVYHYVGCGCTEGCFASGSTKEQAIETWNTRQNPWQTGTPTEEGWYLLRWHNRVERWFSLEYLTIEGITRLHNQGKFVGCHWWKIEEPNEEGEKE